MGVVQARHALEQVLAQLLIQGSKGLIEQQQLGLDGHGSCEGQALSFAAGERGWHALLEATEVDLPKQLGNALLGSIQACVLEHEAQGFLRAHMGPEGRVLEQHPNAASLRRQE